MNHEYLWSFVSLEDAGRASIKHFNSIIGLKPWKSIFRVSVRMKFGSLYEIRYERNKSIVFEADPGSGPSHEWQCLSDKEIYDVARKNGTLDDFKKIF